MKKTVILAAVLTLFAATTAMAEHAASGHKLLVTDVPDPGQIEARIDYVYSYAEGKLEAGEKVKDEKSAGSVFLGAGVAKGLKLSATLPYTFVQHMENERVQGWGDLTLGARYSFNKGFAHLPVDVAVGFDWQLDTGVYGPGRPGAGLNVYSPYFAVSKAVGMVVPYFKYQADFAVKKDRDQTNHNITAGAELEFTHSLSLDASIKTVVNGSRPGLKSSTDVEIELMPYIKVAKNTYLLPKFAYKFAGDLETNDGVKELRDVGEVKTGLGLYFLF
jgi:hypothetical protein